MVKDPSLVKSFEETIAVSLYAYGVIVLLGIGE